MITGYYRCSCHPFNSWDELKKAQKQVLKPGDKVKHACTGVEFEVIKHLERGYYSIKCGDRPCDIHMDHIECLIKINN